MQVGDVVFYVENGKIEMGVIEHISFSWDGDRWEGNRNSLINIVYLIGENEHRLEKDLYTLGRLKDMAKDYVVD